MADWQPYALTEREHRSVLVTPEIAAEWLTRNTENYRLLRPATVAKYAQDIESGLYQYTGEPIQFSKITEDKPEGRLLNGQHRLSAIVQTGIAIELLVVGGLDDQSGHYMDMGIKRTLNDQLRHEGFSNYIVLPAIARLAMTFDTDEQRFFGRRFVLSDPLVREYIGKHEANLIEATDIAARYVKRIKMPGRLLGVNAFHLLQAGYSSEHVEGFFSDLADHKTSGAGDPRSALLVRLDNIKSGHIVPEANMMSALLIRTFNAVQRQETLARLNIVPFSKVPPIVAPTAATPAPKGSRRKSSSS